MSKYPEITNTKYHEMSFDEIDKIREKLAADKTSLAINEGQLFLYLNQIAMIKPGGKNYSMQIRWIQNISIIGFVGTFIFLFINWKISIVLFIISIITQIYSGKLARKYILQGCIDDRVFLKFALGVGLVRVN